MFTGDECRMFYGDGGHSTVYPRTQVSASHVNFFPPFNDKYFCYFGSPYCNTMNPDQMFASVIKCNLI